jgi:hypothetical protein
MYVPEGKYTISGGTNMKRNTNNAARNEEALGRFMGTIAEINERLAELKEFADDHMGYQPEEITHGHVGSAAHFLSKLTELTDMAYKRGEYTD